MKILLRFHHYLFLIETVGESAISIPDVSVVIDSGLEVIKVYNPETHEFQKGRTRRI